MISYAENVREWMSAHPDNIIAVHCKGGKGRTGTMICVWLIDGGLLESASESLEYFGDRRTDLSVGKKFQGVETPSQGRYVGYFDYVRNQLKCQMPEDRKLRLTTILIHAIAGVGKGDGSDLSVEISLERQKVYQANFGPQINCTMRHDFSSDCVTIELLDSPVLVRDVKVLFQCTSKIPKGYDNCPFYLWFNTSFIENNSLYLSRDELDNPHKPKTWHVFRKKFAVELLFSPVEE